MLWLVVGTGIVVALLRGGKLRIEDVGLRAMWVAPAALALQLFSFVAPGTLLNAGLILTSYSLLVYGLVRNSHLQSLRLVLLGVILNMLVIAANGGRMPVDPRAAQASRVNIESVLAGAEAKHVVAGPETRLSFLGDVIPVPLVRRVISVGDIAISLGLFLLIQDLMGRRLEIDLGPGG